MKFLVSISLFFGSVFHIGAIETGTKPLLESPNAIVVKDIDTKVFCSGIRPLILRIKEIKNSTKATLVSTRFPKELNRTKEVKDGCAELVMNYEKLQNGLEQPDTISISFEILDVRTPETTAIKLTIYPVIVELAEKGPEMRSFSTHIDFRFHPEFDRKGLFQYKVHPWDPELTKHIHFAAIPAYFCDGKLSFSQQRPEKEKGEVGLLGSASAPGMTAVTAMLGQDLWIECCPKRFSVYLDFQGKVPLNAPAPTKEEAEAADKVLDEIFPKPRNESTEKGIRKLSELFHAHGVPFLPEGLRSLSEFTRSTAVKDAELPWEELILAAAEYSIRFALPPPKPNLNEKK